METVGEAEAALIVSDFICQRNLDVQNFLHNKAIDFEKKSLSRTYLIIDEEYLSPNDRLIIYGYFTIAMKVLEFEASVSKSKKQKLANNKDVNHVAGYLIGQLGKNDTYSADITGKEIMDFSMELIDDLHQKLGGRFVYLECEDTPSLIAFYERLSFQKLQTTSLVQMYKALP